jgi:hypothetical protein
MKTLTVFYVDAAEQLLPALAGAKADWSNLIPPFLAERTRISSMKSTAATVVGSLWTASRSPAAARAGA